MSVLAVACSSEETPEVQPQQTADIEQTQEQSNPSYNMNCNLCRQGYVFPVNYGGPAYTQIDVTFSNSLTTDELYCLKFKYFECWYKGYLFRTLVQPDNDPYTETWLVQNGKPEGDLLNDICNDPLTSSSNCDD